MDWLKGTVFSVEQIGQMKWLPANPTGLENFWSHCWQKNLKIGSFVERPEELEACSFAGAGISARQEGQYAPLSSSPLRGVPQVEQKKEGLIFSLVVASMARGGGTPDCIERRQGSKGVKVERPRFSNSPEY